MRKIAFLKKKNKTLIITQSSYE